MGRAFGTNKDIEKIIRHAKRTGWTVTITGGNHIRFLSPDKTAPIIIGSLTSSSNSAKYLRRDLARAGLDVASA